MFKVKVHGLNVKVTSVEGVKLLCETFGTEETPTSNTLENGEVVASFIAPAGTTIALGKQPGKQGNNATALPKQLNSTNLGPFANAVLSDIMAHAQGATAEDVAKRHKLTSKQVGWVVRNVQVQHGAPTIVRLGKTHNGRTVYYPTPALTPNRLTTFLKKLGHGA